MFGGAVGAKGEKCTPDAPSVVIPETKKCAFLSHSILARLLNDSRKVPLTISNEMGNDIFIVHDNFFFETQKDDIGAVIATKLGGLVRGISDGKTEDYKVMVVARRRNGSVEHAFYPIRANVAWHYGEKASGSYNFQTDFYSNAWIESLHFYVIRREHLGYFDKMPSTGGKWDDAMGLVEQFLINSGLPYKRHGMGTMLRKPKSATAPTTE